MSHIKTHYTFFTYSTLLVRVVVSTSRSFGYLTNSNTPLKRSYTFHSIINKTRSQDKQCRSHPPIGRASLAAWGASLGSSSWLGGFSAPVCFSAFPIWALNTSPAYSLANAGTAWGSLRLLCSDPFKAFINLYVPGVFFEVFCNKYFNLSVIDLYLAHSKRNFKWQIVDHFLFQWHI